jgi:hypothetical protein
MATLQRGYGFDVAPRWPLEDLSAAGARTIDRQS